MQVHLVRSRKRETAYFSKFCENHSENISSFTGNAIQVQPFCTPKVQGFVALPTKFQPEKIGYEWELHLAECASTLLIASTHAPNSDYRVSCMLCTHRIDPLILFCENFILQSVLQLCWLLLHMRQIAIIGLVACFVHIALTHWCLNTSLIVL